MQKYMLGFLLLCVGSVNAMDSEEKVSRVAQPGRFAWFTTIAQKAVVNVLQPIANFIYKSNQCNAEILESLGEVNRVKGS